MSGFLTNLTATKIAEVRGMGRAKWRIENDLLFDSNLVGLITVPAGFVCDFASVPRAPFAYWFTGDTAHASAVVHDYLCREWYPSAKISWRRAADVFREAMREEGVPAWRRALMHWAVVGADPSNKTGVEA